MGGFTSNDDLQHQANMADMVVSNDRKEPKEPDLDEREHAEQTVEDQS